MPDTIKPGAILIKEGTLLPENVRFETESCVPGWRLVKDLDGDGLDRKIREAGWTFLCVAGQIGASVFGIDEQKTLSRAVEQILANLESAEFNSLEIKRVASEASKRFLGVRYVTVSAQSGHIQESAPLFPGEGPSGEGPRTISCRLNQSIGLARGNGLPQGEMIALIKVETILNL